MDSNDNVLAPDNLSWWLFKGTGQPHDIPEDSRWHAIPPWRRFLPSTNIKAKEPPGMSEREEQIGQTYLASDRVKNLVNAALYLRRPLLVTGNPGTGKSSLAYAVAYELNLGSVLHWPITSRSTLAEGLYRYDAIGRLHEAQVKSTQTNYKVNKPGEEIGNFIELGPLGTALLPTLRPRALLIDEIDKSNIDLPNDLLHVLETGEYDIPELARIKNKFPAISVQTFGKNDPITITDGHVICCEFPFIVITSNGERELPPPFLRRCIRLNIKDPNHEQLAEIVEKKFDKKIDEQVELIQKFIEHRASPNLLSTDQLLNALYLTQQGVKIEDTLDNYTKQQLIDVIFQPINR